MSFLDGPAGTSMNSEKIKTAFWFLKRPSYYAYAMELAARKLRPNRDSPFDIQQATKWAEQRTVSVPEAIARVGLLTERGIPPPAIPDSLLHQAQDRAKTSTVKMGGAAHINLLFAAVRLSRAARVVETGVAYGWSSLAILAAQKDLPESHLVSVDMPYPKVGNDPWVGVVVPDELRSRWTLVRQPDRNGLEVAIRAVGGQIELCHYDSDKSYWGRRYGYSLLWAALRPGGLFISDDIQDNTAFAEFVEAQAVPYAVTAFEGKFAGIAKKV